MTQLHITVNYADDAKTFVVDFPEEFFPSKEGVDVIGKEAYDEIVRSNVVNHFYENFNLTIIDEDGREI